MPLLYTSYMNVEAQLRSETAKYMLINSSMPGKQICVCSPCVLHEFCVYLFEQK